MDTELYCVRCKGANILQEASVMLPVNDFIGAVANLTRQDKLVWSDLYYCEDCEDYLDVTDDCQPPEPYIPQDEASRSEGETS
jgi:hypothetical protein